MSDAERAFAMVSGVFFAFAAIVLFAIWVIA